MNKTAFVRAVHSYVAKAMPDAGIRPQLMVVTHAAYESGWGGSKPFRRGYNLFNITAPKGSELPTLEGEDLEYDKSGSVKKITQLFRSYADFEESVRDYLEFIDRPRYKPALSQLLKGDFTYVETLGKGGYYTLPVPTFCATYAAVFRSVVRGAMDAGIFGAAKAQNYPASS